MNFKVDFKQVFENVKEKILSFVDTLIDFYEEDKKKALIIASAILIVLISLLIILAVTGSKKEKKTIQIQEHLELSENLVIPDGPVLPREYNLSRKTKDKWTEDDVKDWFTVPSDKEIDALSKSNDAIVNEIIGAAP